MKNFLNAIAIGKKSKSSQRSPNFTRLAIQHDGSFSDGPGLLLEFGERNGARIRKLVVGSHQARVGSRIIGIQLNRLPVVIFGLKKIVESRSDVELSGHQVGVVGFQVPGRPFFQ